MRVKVLGSAAGGGFPQWNCGCPNCSGLRNGTVNSRPRTQTQIAIAADPEYALRAYWTLVNASPDLRSQIVATPEFAPFSNTRSSTPIFDVYLQSADVDSLMGLLHLREFQAFKIFSMPAIRRILSEENSMFEVLGRAKPPVQWFSMPFAPHLNSAIHRPRRTPRRRVSRLHKQEPASHAASRRSGYRFGLRVRRETRLRCTGSAWAQHGMEEMGRIQRPRPHRWHLLDRQRAAPDRSEPKNSSSNRPLADFRSGRINRAVSEACQRSQSPDPHQQHESDP